jgi:hypothetical protein
MPVVFKVSYLEFHITHQCNLHCDGCANYRNYGFKNEMSFDENKEYLRLWSRRIQPGTFRLLGGEPSLHSQMLDYVLLAQSLWPDAARWLVTNGAFLHRYKDLEEVLRSTGTALHLSFHSNDPKYLDWVRPIIAHIKTFQGVNVSYGDYRKFRRLYRGVGPAMLPYADNDPVQSFRNCLGYDCKNIGNGRLWKCPAIMGLRDVLKRFEIEDSPDWAPYLKYEGVGLDASDEELHAFFTAGPEDICNMCPKSPPVYNKDIYNVNWQRNAERLEWEGEDIDVKQFVYSIEPEARA